MYNEEEALRLLSEGDERGFKAIYDQYAPAIFTVCRKFLDHDDEAALDVVQELFMKLWGPGREQFVRTEEFRLYFFTTAKNMALRALKQKSMQVAVEYTYVRLNPRPPYATIELEEEDNIVNMNLLMRAVEKLPPQQKQVFTLGYLQNLTHEEIATHLNIATPTVNNHMGAALNFIRKFDPDFIPETKKKKADEMQAKALELWRSGMKYKDIARELGLKVPSIYAKVQRALRGG